MRRTRTSLLRRTVMWAAGVVPVVSVAAWLASLFGVGWGFSTGVVGVSEGAFIVFRQRQSNPYPSGWITGEASLYQHWWPWDLWSPGLVIVPLWLPATLAAVSLTWTSLVGRHARVQRRRGFCPSCGYDLTGLTGPCPECGRER